MIESQAGREPVEEVAEHFLARYRRGERPAITEYTQKHPELAEEIRDLFPALVVMEEAGPRQASPAGFSGKITADGQTPRRLGEYRVLREIGRGGMGVVYEAEQEALGRHVALKVLPYDIAADTVRLRRFCREARAAARLHHTNIVPVYDVGEHQGVHYYAMQFIQGQGLDQVLTELRRLRLHEQPPSPEVSDLSHSLAEQVQSGRFDLSNQSDARHVSPDDHEPEPGAPDPQEGSFPAQSGTSLVDPLSSSSQSDYRYYRSVAGVGMQVAEALAHAHGKKVLHRDIKPSNLLLDLYGRVWVTDFGLAKDDSDELTHAGDVIGTLRYMAPERFSGHSDARGDVYSLGLTLYELLTLRAAFEETDRGLLIRRITHQEPIPPRKLDPRVPRDLETIVLKAIAKEPNRRYLKAEALAEDLRRFLTDRPILARRTSWAGHAWRWIRRNPGWAATVAAALLFLVVAAAGGTVQNLFLQRALTDAQNAERDKTEKLWQSYMEQARAERSSNRVGQRFASLNAIREAARLRVTPELRDEAIAALALPDVQLIRDLHFPQDTTTTSFDADFRHYACLTRDGRIAVYRLTDTGEEVVATLPAHGETPFSGPWLSPDARFVACASGYAVQGVSRNCRVWQIDGSAPSLRLDDPSGVHEAAIAFRPDCRRLAIGHADGTVSLYDLETGRTCPRWKLGTAPHTLAFHPKDGRLAAACGNTVRIWDSTSGAELPPLRHPERVTWITGVAWHPQGKRLATSSNDFRIHVWDVDDAVEIMAPWTGEIDQGIFLAYNSRGDRVLSTGWSGQTRLWDATTGRMMLTLPGFGTVFSKDECLFGGHDGKPGLWRLAAGRELRVLRGRTAELPQWYFSPVVDPRGRVVAASAENWDPIAPRTRLSFFDLHGGEELASVTLGSQGAQPVFFHSSGGWTTAGSAGLLLWPERRDQDAPDRLWIGPPRRLAPYGTTGASGTADGRVLAIAQGNQALILDNGPPRRRVVLGPQYDVRNTAVSPDGRWAVTCSHWWDGRSPTIRIWDARTGRLVHDLPLEESTRATFSADGRWLVTQSSGGGCRFWEVPTWKPGLHLPQARAALLTPDGRLVAVSDSLGTIRLLDVATGREAIRLTGPEAAWYFPSCFTPDATCLIAMSSSSHGLYVWDLPLLKADLEELGLAAHWPDLLPVPAACDRPEPLTVKLDCSGVQLPVPFADDRLTVAVYTLALAACPLSSPAYLQRGQAYGRLGQSQNAVPDYSRYLALAGTGDEHRAEVLLRRATNFQKLGDYNRALIDLGQFLRYDPDLVGLSEQTARLCNIVAWHQIVSKTNNVTEVLCLAQRATELAPFNPAYQNTLGAALYRAGRWQACVDCLERNLPGNRAIASYDLFFLAMGYQRLGRTERARDCFDRANKWLEAQIRPSEQNVKELAAFRAEAAAVLGLR
jgi:serine/threonine protein kinase/WD40 repeat protein